MECSNRFAETAQNSQKTVNSVSHDKKEEIPLVKSNDNKRIITEEKMETGNVGFIIFAMIIMMID